MDEVVLDQDPQPRVPLPVHLPPVLVGRLVTPGVRVPVVAHLPHLLLVPGGLRESPRRTDAVVVRVVDLPVVVPLLAYRPVRVHQDHLPPRQRFVSVLLLVRLPPAVVPVHPVDLAPGAAHLPVVLVRVLVVVPVLVPLRRDQVRLLHRDHVGEVKQAALEEPRLIDVVAVRRPRVPVVARPGARARAQAARRR